MRTDRQTDGRTHMTKLIVDFRNFAKAPNITRFESAIHTSILKACKAFFALRHFESCWLFSLLSRGGMLHVWREGRRLVKRSVRISLASGWMWTCDPPYAYEEEMVPVTALEIEFRTSLTQPLRYAANIEKICTVYIWRNVFIHSLLWFATPGNLQLFLNM
jgi:hypothetical protein